MQKVQLNYRDSLGDRQHSIIQVPDDVAFSLGDVSFTRDKTHVVVGFRAPWNGEEVAYAYRNPDHLEPGELALININGDIVVGRVSSYGTSPVYGGQNRNRHKPARRIYVPSDLDVWEYNSCQF